MFETRIYFSFHNKCELEKVIEKMNECLDYYTLYKAVGCYKGVNEPSRILEIIHNYDLGISFKYISEKIKEIANQESVLMTTKGINTEFI